MTIRPRYPIYIPSKGRSKSGLTMKALDKDGTPYRIVVEPQEREVYAAPYGEDRLLVLPENDRGLVVARNWIRAHAESEGHARHWQLDDNMRRFCRLWHGMKVQCDASPALAAVEDFADRYENVGIAGLNYEMFVPKGARHPPIRVNAHVYSCTLIDHAMPYWWRGTYNEDVDICLQAIVNGWCTVQVNVFFVQKVPTMKIGGGNTDALYHGDGRLKMAQALERQWPHVVKTTRRFQRPQHKVSHEWKRFDTPLRLKPGIDLAALAEAGANEYGLDLIVRQTPKSAKLRALLEKEGIDASGGQSASVENDG